MNHLIRLSVWHTFFLKIQRQYFLDKRVRQLHKLSASMDDSSLFLIEKWYIFTDIGFNISRCNPFLEVADVVVVVVAEDAHHDPAQGVKSDYNGRLHGLAKWPDKSTTNYNMLDFKS